MACFMPLKDYGVLVYADKHVAVFQSDKGLKEVRINSGTLNYKNYRATKEALIRNFDRAKPLLWLYKDEGDTQIRISSGAALILFQELLEAAGGSVLVPVTDTKDSYVYIPGQRDYAGDLIS